MCKAGNGSIFRGCFEALLAQNGHKQLRQADMRAILRQHGGCMQVGGIDKKEKKVLILKNTTLGQFSFCVGEPL